MALPTDFEFNEISDAADAIREFIIVKQDVIPDHLRQRLFNLTRTGVSPVELVTAFVRAVYAHRKKAGVGTSLAMKIAAAAADLIDMKGFHGRLEGRAGKMALALRRDAGLPPPEGKTWPVEAQDPAIDASADAGLLPPDPEPLAPPPPPAQVKRP